MWEHEGRVLTESMDVRVGGHNGGLYGASVYESGSSGAKHPGERYEFEALSSNSFLRLEVNDRLKMDTGPLLTEAEKE